MSDDLGEGRVTLYKSKEVWTHPPSKSFGGMYCRGVSQIVRNPGVMDGGVRGKTDTDYFYFLCPKCRGVLQWHLLHFFVGPSDYPEKRERGIKEEHLRVEIRCAHCKLVGYIKINNDCWQDGKI